MASVAMAQDTPDRADARVCFVNLADGDTSPVTVVFGPEGMGARLPEPKGKTRAAIICCSTTSHAQRQ